MCIVLIPTFMSVFIFIILKNLIYIVFSTFLCVVPTPAVTISPSGPMEEAMVGSPQVINCTVSTVSGVESSSIMISWMGPGENSIIGDSRVTISPTTSSGNNHTSSLQFTYLMERDEGTYTCNVIILESTVSQSVEMSLKCKYLACMVTSRLAG